VEITGHPETRQCLLVRAARNAEAFVQDSGRFVQPGRRHYRASCPCPFQNRRDENHEHRHDWHTLSGGEKQRTQLARALAQEPREILLDEPTNHLDIRNQIELLDLLGSLDATCVVAMHDLNLAARYCDHVVVLDHGQVVAAGGPEAVLTPDLIESVYGVRALVDREPTTGIPRITFLAAIASGPPATKAMQLDPR
jgi:iron complex transport system ATP-binding protein